MYAVKFDDVCTQLALIRCLPLKKPQMVAVFCFLIENQLLKNSILLLFSCELSKARETKTKLNGCFCFCCDLIKEEVFKMQHSLNKYIEYLDRHVKSIFLHCIINETNMT